MELKYLERLKIQYNPNNMVQIIKSLTNQDVEEAYIAQLEELYLDIKLREDKKVLDVDEKQKEEIEKSKELYRIKFLPRNDTKS